MGLFNVEFGVAGLAGDGSETVSAIVDTGAIHSMLPASLLNRLGIEPAIRRDFEVADGGTVTYDIGLAMFTVFGERMGCPVIFGSEGRYLMGATTLENFNLVVDPTNERLMPVSDLYI